jgi:hypothetical protein
LSFNSGKWQMRLVVRRQAFEPLQRLPFNAPLLVVVQGMGSCPLAAGAPHVAQCLGELQHTQALPGHCSSGFILTPSFSSSASASSTEVHCTVVSDEAQYYTCDASAHVLQ